MFDNEGNFIDPTAPEVNDPIMGTTQPKPEESESTNAFADLMSKMGVTPPKEETLTEEQQEEADLLKALNGEDPSNEEDEPDKTSIVLTKLIDRLEQGDKAETSQLTEHFNSVFGDPINFEQMMQDEGDTSEVAKNIQEEVRSKMEAVYSDVLKQSVSLAEQMVQKQLENFREEFKTETSMSRLNSMIAAEIPKAVAPENKVILDAVLPPLMKHAGNDPDKAFKLLVAFFRKTNKSLLGNNEKRGRFGSAQPAKPRSGVLNLETLVGFLG